MLERYQSEVDGHKSGSPREQVCRPTKEQGGARVDTPRSKGGGESVQDGSGARHNTTLHYTTLHNKVQKLLLF